MNRNPFTSPCDIFLFAFLQYYHNVFWKGRRKLLIRFSLLCLTQKFCQPSGNGNDLGFFDTNDLSKPLKGDVFPLVILAESTAPSTTLDMQTDAQIVKAPSHAQITLAILEKNKESQFQVKVMKQILWVEGNLWDQ
ncbi:hypothetical protein LIER_11360 [Lithospermum erythrorhizon]|uniref:RING-type E3 ubiquitin transferase n=1 Tax=Lithospermum erythrorhizon TaxID=34254 RepID=A0AAV3PPN9_LITER